MRRLREWPYWLPVLNGVWQYLEALGIYRRPRPPVIPMQRDPSGDYSRPRSTLT